MGKPPEDVDAYLETFPDDVRDVLGRIRRTAHDAVPGATEKISYGIPTLVLDGRSLVHFAGWKQHVSLYPAPDDHALAQRIEPYHNGKGTLRFPLDRPVPYDLVADVVRALAASRAD
ncbi:iron chaperone [Angustibacter luteus]|uniref:Iron chaperone n=1 Tax=Angustibacter luteus TaxID=658456 RepID=A0ABW1JBW3_9ACTN